MILKIELSRDQVIPFQERKTGEILTSSGDCAGMDSTTLAVHVPCVTSCPDYDVRLVTNIFDACVGKGEKGEIGEGER